MSSPSLPALSASPGDSPALTVLAPLLIERAALAGALPANAQVLHTGMGPEKSQRLDLPPGTDPVVITGVAGGLHPDLQPGDLLVATEIRGDGPPIPVPSAQLLAGALRRLGLRVHLGPLHSSATVVRGPDRQSFGDAWAVDMESAWLARRIQASSAPSIPRWSSPPSRPSSLVRPFAVVRAIADTTEKPLLSPGTPLRSFQALRTLRRAAPALTAWAAVAGVPREVVLAAPRSFCAGVERAIEIVDRCLEQFGAPVYVRRQIVHNTQVVRELTEKGAVFVQEADEVPEGEVLVLAAHGVAPSVRKQAAERNLTVVDGTCPLVSKVHAEVRRFAQRGETVFLVGHSDHEEVEGTFGEAPENVVVVATEDEARAATVANPDHVSYVTQTTLSRQDTSPVIKALAERFPRLAAPPTEDVCFATTNRQAAVTAIAHQVDLVIVVGSANSSNSRRLVEVAETAGTRARLIDDPTELDLTDLAGVHRIGVTAGASAPPDLVDALITNLSGLGPVSQREHRVTDETVTFSLPPGVS
jgi:4-hydroxy-3-methylbut-2-enyl diphosphate reductase